MALLAMVLDWAWVAMHNSAAVTTITGFIVASFDISFHARFKFKTELRFPQEPYTYIVKTNVVYYSIIWYPYDATISLPQLL